MERKNRLVLWGASYDYDIYWPWIELQVLKKTVEIEAIVLFENHFASEIDGVPVVSADKISTLDMDYLVALTQESFDMILKIAPQLGIARNKIIQVDLFGLPNFDFSKWVKVKESNVTILSNHCWGGMTYESLQLPFMSPFVGMFLSDNDYIKILSNLDYYLKAPLELLEWVEAGEKRYPIVQCGDVTLHMNHHFGSWETTIAKWKRRCERVNINNLCVTMWVNEKEYMESFLALPYVNKLVFTTLPIEGERIISMNAEYVKSKYGDNLFQAPLTQVRVGKAEFTRYNVLDVLLGEQIVQRIQ